MPVNTVKVQRECIQITGFTCDKCRKTYKTDIDEDLTGFGEEFDEMHHIDFVGGYGSPFGDGMKVSATICRWCLYNLIKNFAYIRENSYNA